MLIREGEFDPNSWKYTRNIEKYKKKTIYLPADFESSEQESEEIIPYNLTPKRSVKQFRITKGKMKNGFLRFYNASEERQMNSAAVTPMQKSKRKIMNETNSIDNTIKSLLLSINNYTESYKL